MLDRIQALHYRYDRLEKRMIERGQCYSMNYISHELNYVSNLWQTYGMGSVFPRYYSIFTCFYN